MKLEAASLSHIGQVRQRNEDAIGYFHPQESAVRDQKGSLFVVADGMGGHRGGEVASQLAVDTVVASYYSAAEDGPAAALEQAFKDANKVIVERSRSDVTLYGMGTTCTALVLRDDEAFIAHVGDTRAYRLRDNILEQLTEDHSLVWEMVRQGILTDEDARTHPRRNVITRSIGTHEELSVDAAPTPLPLRDGDVFLLCSDGLTSLVPERDVKAVLDANPPRAACDLLVDLANEAGGKDNVTVLVVRVQQGD